jgi:DNA-binding CsgD family transcriptional regulator
MGDGAVRGVTCESDDLRLMSAIAAWYEVIQGGAALKRALETLCDAFGAEAAAVARYDRTRSTTRIIYHDAELRDILVPRLSRSFAHCVLGDYAGKVRPATIWSSTMVPDPDPALTHFQERRALRELIVIPLGTIDTGDDYLELHYRENVDQRLQLRLQYVAETLCHAWRNRDPGLFVERMLASDRTARGRAETQDILAFGNPARLSRAEYRVCLLLSRGLSNESVREELSITASTLRSHLRSIYDKAGVESKAELVFHLLSSKAQSQNRRMTG